MTDYASFLAAKAPRVHPVGIEPGPMPAHLFDYQAAAVIASLRRGRGALFLDTGLGKTVCELEFAAQAGAATNGRSLILTPLAVARQIEAEAKRFGYNARVIRDASQVADGISICNYDRLDLLDPTAFGCVVLDECFAKGTKIDTPEGGKDIEDIRVGDHILNCAGVDVVSDVHRREVAYGVLVKVAGASFIASPNHPIFTQRGWVGAQHLRAGDHALATGAALRLVRDGICPEVFGTIRPEVLRDILLSEMADDSIRSVGKGAFERDGCQTGGEASCLVAVREPGSLSRTGADYHAQSLHPAGSPGQDFSYVARNEARTVRAWGQWSRADVAASVDAGCAWERMGSGISVVTGPKEAWIPNLLQTGLRQYEIEGRDRGGWSVPLGSEGGSGPEARRHDRFVRVDGVEVLESGDPRLEQFREADGKLYFYDLGATRHPSYSVAGLLVHNSSILKSFAGKTTRALIEMFARTPFRLAATATPAPNDHTELGQHAEFLGVMTQMEMLVRWFINDSADTGNWRLKGHAVDAFWNWVASWAVMAESPADLGFDASRFALPDLRIIRHKVSADIKPLDGLFGYDVSATAVHGLKRQTATARAEALAAIVAADDEPWVIWCDGNYEADALRHAMPFAGEVRGSMDLDDKERALADFASGKLRALVTKSSICGFGLNWQHCARMAFVGRSFSYEAWYQAVRRCWRFGQTRPVHVHLMVAEGEDQIGRIIDRKAEGHATMKAAMRDAARRSMGASSAVNVAYQPTYQGRLPSWLSAA